MNNFINYVSLVCVAVFVLSCLIYAWMLFRNWLNSPDKLPDLSKVKPPASKPAAVKGHIHKGGVNYGYQITVRPSHPSPQKPATPPVNVERPVQMGYNYELTRPDQVAAIPTGIPAVPPKVTYVVDPPSWEEDTSNPDYHSKQLEQLKPNERHEARDKLDKIRKGLKPRPKRKKIPVSGQTKKKTTKRPRPKSNRSRK